MERIPASTVVANLGTTSDKIRALARAGYLRTEIGKFLQIRYQHVRKVLIDAGITEGKQQEGQFERPPVVVELDSKPHPQTHGSVLLKAGFSFLGEWVALQPGEFELNAKAPARPGVYAFLVDDVVVYVGLAQRGFRMRMGHYRRGHARQRTSARVKGLIATALATGKRVKVLIAEPEALEWKGLPVNTAAGLETGLIRLIRPQWNLLGLSDSLN